VPQTFLQSNMMQMIFLSHNFCKIEVHYIRLQGVVCFLPFFVLLILSICLSHTRLIVVLAYLFFLFVCASFIGLLTSWHCLFTLCATGSVPSFQ
jgi:hypothetical protein